jgi:hypothetical protein
VLTVGAKGAERVARATGVDRVMNEAVEEAIVRALRSPAVVRAIERALESHAQDAERDREQVAQIVKRVLESDAAEGVWTEFLQSDQAQMLVERIAGAPEIRAAIASQGAGLITDIGVRLTVITEELDDALERMVRKRDPESETNQAGLATRTVAAAIDVGLLFAGYLLISGVLTSVVTNVFGSSSSPIVVGVFTALGFVVGGAIFASFWALAGQTPGNAVPGHPPHLPRFAPCQLRLREPACVCRDSQSAPARAWIPRHSARSPTAGLGGSDDRD